MVCTSMWEHLIYSHFPASFQVSKTMNVTENISYFCLGELSYLLCKGSVAPRHGQTGGGDGQEVQRGSSFVPAVCEGVMPHQSTGTTQHDGLTPQ